MVSSPAVSGLIRYRRPEARHTRQRRDHPLRQWPHHLQPIRMVRAIFEAVEGVSRDDRVYSVSVRTEDRLSRELVTRPVTGLFGIVERDEVFRSGCMTYSHTQYVVPSPSGSTSQAASCFRKLYKSSGPRVGCGHRSSAISLSLSQDYSPPRLIGLTVGPMVRLLSRIVCGGFFAHRTPAKMGSLSTWFGSWSL